ncbi:heterokaryon incompatibility protein-domain-containing protein [Hypoxylon sp. FL1284]|nr:heterokaryon incompatibility protein-domain-containing protein [Hypoxylon sp. FL1284]
MRCIHCAEISIRHLVELATVEFVSQAFPQHAYYKHHASIDGLVSSARKGCDLCRLIYHTLKQTPSDHPPQDETLFDIVKELEQSDLRIAISADHIYSSDPLSEVEMFDVLMVQVGPPIVPEASPSDEAYWRPAHARLALQVPREKPLQLGKYRIGRNILDPDLASETNFAVARDWLQKCCETHRECPQDTSMPLPTRVIDVGISGDAPAPRLLVSSGAEGRYATLSHCWGGPISSVLTTQNLKLFQSALPYSDLPLNFRDAISITRHLGIRYLWIDSLCIVQDSRKDWEIESSMMASVYRRALVTISALTSEGPAHGIFKTDETLASPMECVPIPLDDGSSTTVMARTKMPDEEHLMQLELHAKLNSRGWTLQESVLSPRQLCYGKREIHWKCRHQYEASEGIPRKRELYMSTFNILSVLLSSGTTDGADSPALELGFSNCRQEYYALIEEYTSRKLTFDSDKLPSFSTLARLVHPAFEGEYLAGIWATDLRRGLLWQKEMRTC